MNSATDYNRLSVSHLPTVAEVAALKIPIWLFQKFRAPTFWSIATKSWWSNANSRPLEFQGPADNTGTSVTPPSDLNTSPPESWLRPSRTVHSTRTELLLLTAFALSSLLKVLTPIPCRMISNWKLTTCLFLQWGTRWTLKPILLRLSFCRSYLQSPPSELLLLVHRLVPTILNLYLYHSLSLALAFSSSLVLLTSTRLQGMQALLDVISASDGSIADSAKLLGWDYSFFNMYFTLLSFAWTLSHLTSIWCFSLSTGGLSRLILSHDGLRMAVNSMRAAKVRANLFTLPITVLSFIRSCF